MAITNIQFIDENENLAAIFTDDNTPLANCTSPYPFPEKIRVLVQAWLDDNGGAPNPASTKDPMDLVRSERDNMIKGTSWIVERHRSQLDLAAEPNVPNSIVSLTNEQFIELLVYRQALRDVPQNQPDATIDTVVWPTKPSFLQ